MASSQKGMQSFESIPEPLEIVPLEARNQNPVDDNPFALGYQLGLIYPELFKVKLQVSKEDKGETETDQYGRKYVEIVWLTDIDTIQRVLADTTLWRKGPGTFEPFLSIVPKHLIGLEDNIHKKLRSAAQDALRHQIQTRALDVARQEAQVFGSKLMKFTNGRLIHSLDKMVRALALDIITSLLFGVSWEAQLDYSETNIKAYSLSKIMYLLHWRVTDRNDRLWRKEPHDGKLLNYTKPLHEYINHEISSRRKYRKRDMLSYWISEYPELNDDELLNLCMTFLTMGHENVGSALSWTLLLLAENEEAQQKVRNEVTKASEGRYPGKLTLFDLNNSFHYAEASYYESIRLYPSVPALTRLNHAETKLCGYEIPKGTEIAINLYAYHRNPRIWGNNAKSFLPARHLMDDHPVPGSVGFAPFGGGSRVCIGRFLGVLEFKILVSEILPRYRLYSCSGKRIRPNNFVSLRPGTHQIRVQKHSSNF